jgi:hypothetical protein
VVNDNAGKYCYYLTVGLVLLSMQYANGYIDPEGYTDPKMYGAIVKYNALEELVNYCFEHATDSAHPIKDLVDKGFLPPEYEGQDCATIKRTFDKGPLHFLNETR